MRILIRFGKYNLVGVIGSVVQLTALAIINRLIPGHYLLATAAAIEIVLLHNFTWHLHYTWSDRRDASSVQAKFLRYQFSNGLVSLFGNLALMRIFVQQAHIPVVAANCIAILCCSGVNFLLGNNWAFAEGRA